MAWRVVEFIRRYVMSDKDKKIICYKCKKDTGYTEEIVTNKEDIKEDIKCPHCGAVIVPKQIDYC